MQYSRIIVIFIISTVDSSFVPPVFYENDISWLDPWHHKKMITRDGTVTDAWKKPNIEICLYKTWDWPESMEATDEENFAVQQAIDEILRIVRSLLEGVRERQTGINAVIPRQCAQPIGNIQVATHCDTSKGQKCTSRAYCHDLPVPDEHADGCTEDGKIKFKKGPGFDYDLLVYISMKRCNGSELANAIPCQYDSQYLRPMAGRIAICRNNIGDYLKLPRQLMNLLLHEFFHVLIYPIYGTRYWNFKTKSRWSSSGYTTHDRTWLSAAGVFNRRAVMTNLTNVQKYVREHFGCSDLAGAEMDNSSGGMKEVPYGFGHWEMRLFPDALLSPIYQPGLELSKLEVALVQDTGWYEVNANMGRHLSVTRNKGCDFAKKSCYEYMQSVNFDRTAVYPYCIGKDEGKWMCSLDYTHTSYCDGKMKDNDNVLPDFRLDNEKESFLGPVNTEYCPMVTPKYVVKGDSSPYCQENQAVDFRIYNAYGGARDAMCVRYGHLEVDKKGKCCPDVKQTNVGICVKKRNCSLTNRKIYFEFGGHVQECTFNQSGEKIDFDFSTSPGECQMSGTFCCPDFETFCETGDLPYVRMDQCHALVNFADKKLLLINLLFLLNFFDL